MTTTSRPELSPADYSPEDFAGIQRAEEICAGLSDLELYRLAGLAKHLMHDRVEALPQPHPAWCSHDDQCSADYDGHPDDWESRHQSASVDSWTPDNGDHPVNVYVIGSRHPDSARDWPDSVVADNTSPGCMGGLDLEVTDARRLAHALLKACELAETDPAKVQS